MQYRMKYMIVFMSIVGFCLLTFKNNLFTVEQSESSWRLLIGEKMALSFKRSITSKVKKKKSEKLEFGIASPVQILLWSKLYGELTAESVENILFPSYGKPKLSCPVDYSFVTDRNMIDSSSGVMVHIEEAEDIPLTNSTLILQYDEPPIEYSKLSSDVFMNKFHYSIGYRMDSDFPNPRIYRPNITTPVDFNQKYDNAVAVFSHCNKVRTEYTRELSRNFRIKSFGDCLRNIEKNNIARVHENRYISSKIRRIRLFKFTLVFMKYDCEDYIDEQLNHSWNAGTLPIFLGTESIEDILPNYLKTSFISVSNFLRPIELADYLDGLTLNRYNYERYMSWREKKTRDFDENKLWKIWNPDYSPGCQIAMKLIKDRFVKQPKKSLKSIQCTERDINWWLNKRQSNVKANGKIVSD